jgi:predicted amidophosphoribosyltransferase
MPTNESPFDWLEKMRQLISACVVCKRASAKTGATCESCIDRLISAPVLCAQCWLPHEPLEEGAACPFGLRSTRSPRRERDTPDSRAPDAAPVHAFLYASGHTHEFLKAWKRGDDWNRLDHSLKWALGVRFQSKWEQIRSHLQADWVVPIPQSFERRMELHGGSALRFAQLASKELQIPWVSLLQTSHQSFQSKQSGRSLTQRFESEIPLQLRKTAAKLWRHPTRRPRVILVDDIITSGRTLLTACDFLESQGYPVAGFVGLGFRPPNPPGSTA